MEAPKFIDGKAVVFDALSGAAMGIFKRGIGLDLMIKSFCAKPFTDNPITRNNKYNDFTRLKFF